MADTTTMARAADSLADLCREARELIAAGPTIPSDVAHRLNEEATLHVQQLLSELTVLRALLERRDVELAQLVSEREAVIMLMGAGIPDARCLELSQALKSRSDSRAAAVAAMTGR